jgi:DNA-binding CsgD family transcriptional regulator/PAS domain-containing protein
MVTVEDFSRLVAGIYAAPVASQRWQDALRDIHRTLDGIACGLLMTDGPAWSLDNSTIPAGAAQSYAEYYYRLDRVLVATQRGPAGAVRTGSELMPLVRKSEFYEDWLQPLDIDDGLFVRLTSGSRPACLIVAASRRSFDTPERVKLVSGLVQHFQQAMRTQDKLADLANRTVEMAGALEVIRHGVVIVAGDHLVINLNSAAERIVRAQDGLCMRSGRIAATSTHAEQELHCAIQNALVAGQSIVRTGRSFTCVRPSGKRPYVIHVLPSHRRDADEPLGRPMAVLLIIDPEDEPEPAAALLRRLYRLTDAEAEVALHVMHGADVKQISDELSVSLPTVRTHLQRIFDKTDAHRQAELVHLLLALSP